jgi:excisionase family DNA binding protein
MAKGREKLLTASDLARLCEVDLKTIHNWVDRGKIRHFRTPGRHLRFRAVDAVEFLRVWGYAVPRELARVASRSVIVAGSDAALAAILGVVGDAAPVRHVRDPFDALVLVGAEPAEIVVIEESVAQLAVDVAKLFDALRRALPKARLVLLYDAAPLALPSWVEQIDLRQAGALSLAVA